MQVPRQEPAVEPVGQLDGYHGMFELPNPHSQHVDSVRSTTTETTTKTMLFCGRLTDLRSKRRGSPLPPHFIKVLFSASIFFSPIRRLAFLFSFSSLQIAFTPAVFVTVMNTNYNLPLHRMSLSSWVRCGVPGRPNVGPVPSKLLSSISPSGTVS